MSDISRSRANFRNEKLSCRRSVTELDVKKLRRKFELGHSDEVLPYPERNATKMDLSNLEKNENLITDNRISQLKKISIRLSLSYQISKWKYYISLKKQKEEDLKVETKIAGFLQRLYDKKKKTKGLSFLDDESASKSKTKSIKIKIETKRNNVHEEDLKRLSNEITKSAETTVNQLKNKSIQNLHPSLRGKAKLIRVLSAVQTPVVATSTVHVNFPVPDILLKMSEKDKERKRRWEMLLLKKRQQIEDRDRLIEERHKQQLALEAMEKRRKVAEFREKQRQKQIREERRKLIALKYERLKNKAYEHYNRKLLKNSFKYWLQFLIARKMLVKNAEARFQLNLKQKVFTAWREEMEASRQFKENSANNFYERNLLRKYFTSWRRLGKIRRDNWQVAEDWYDIALQFRFFKTWLNHFRRKATICRERMRDAEKFYKRKLLQRCLESWKVFPEVMKREKEFEERKQIWRYKVQQILPDFQPPISSLDQLYIM